MSFKERGHSFIARQGGKKGWRWRFCPSKPPRRHLLRLRGWTSAAAVSGSQFLLAKEPWGLHPRSGGGHILRPCPFPLVSFSSPLYLVKYLILWPFEDWHTCFPSPIPMRFTGLWCIQPWVARRPDRGAHVCVYRRALSVWQV